MEVSASLVFQHFIIKQILAYHALQNTLIVYPVLKIIVGSANQDILLLCSQAHIVYLKLKADSQHQSLDAYRAQFMGANIAVIESIQKAFSV